MDRPHRHNGLGATVITLPVNATALTHPPLPIVTSLTEPFWDGVASRKLMICHCADCNHLIHPPRPVCNRCMSTNIDIKEMSGLATLYTYTVTVQVFHPFYADKVPYVSAVVELDEQPGLRLTTIIVDCPEERLHVGLPVDVVWTEAGPDWVLPYFRPRTMANAASQSADAQGQST
jgi:uncharacterized protein